MPISVRLLPGSDLYGTAYPSEGIAGDDHDSDAATTRESPANRAMAYEHIRKIRIYLECNGPTVAFSSCHRLDLDSSRQVWIVR